jgi:hypothetical protein
LHTARSLWERVFIFRSRPRGIKDIVGLPSNLFYGTGIPACILALDKVPTDAIA